MASQFGAQAVFPLPLDSSSEFEAAFCSTPSKGPSSLPHPSPSKAFWTHPGLSKDWPQDDSDPEGNKRVNPLATEGRETRIEHEADVVIIGSGITGVSVALELSKLSRANGERSNVVIFEARDFCSGATGRNGGHLTANISQHFSTLATLYPPEEVKRCFELEGHTVSSILEMIKTNGWEKDVDLIQGGHNVLMFSDAEAVIAREDWIAAQKAGIDQAKEVEWFTLEETKERYGASYPSFRSGGHNLWPLKLVTNMFMLARDGPKVTAQFSPDASNNAPDSSDSPTLTCGEGVVNFVKSFIPASQPLSVPVPEKSTAPLVDEKSHPASNTQDPFHLALHTHTPVLSVTQVPCPDASCPVRYDVKTERGWVRTKVVVYATNAYTSYLLPQFTGPDGIVPVRGQVVAVRAAVGYEDEGDKEGITRSGWSGNEGFEYWFPRPHPSPSVNQEKPRPPLVILGGARETLRDRGYGMYETDDSVLDSEASAGLRRFLPVVFPGQFGAKDAVEVEWTGIMGFTKSGDPFVGRVLDANGNPVVGQFMACGFTGHGMPRAYGCAEALATLIWADKAHSRWEPPEWLPRHYLTQKFD